MFYRHSKKGRVGMCRRHHSPIPIYLNNFFQTRLVNLIHSMGGSIRRELNSKITHLICNATGGEKYQYAMTFRLAVIRPSWVYKAWEKRDQKGFTAIGADFTKPHRLKSFEGQKICFLGFSQEEHQHMVDILTANGGVATDIEDPECSHVVSIIKCNFFFFVNVTIICFGIHLNGFWEIQCT